MKKLNLTEEQLKENIIYWIVPVFGCVEPESLIGPFLTYENMLEKAKEVHKTQSEDDALFYLRIEHGIPWVDAFAGRDFLE